MRGRCHRPLRRRRCVHRPRSCLRGDHSPLRDNRLPRRWLRWRSRSWWRAHSCRRLRRRCCRSFWLRRRRYDDCCSRCWRMYRGGNDYCWRCSRLLCLRRRCNYNGRRPDNRRCDHNTLFCCRCSRFRGNDHGRFFCCRSRRRGLHLRSCWRHYCCRFRRRCRNGCRRTRR